MTTRLENVNQVDIADAIRLACRTMQRVFNADDTNIPFFGSTIRPETQFYFSNNYTESHIPGRHLNSLLHAEAILGVEVDAEAVANHRRAAFYSYSGPVALPLNRKELDGPLLNFGPHNIREGLHALYALTRYRQDGEAEALARQSVQAILELWDPNHGWDETQLAALGVTYKPSGGFIGGEGRMIGPLVKFFRCTGYGPALELALLLRDKALQFFTESGDYDVERFVTRHSHSVTSVLSSLALLADLLKDTYLMQRVRAFYDVGLLEMRDEIGWSPEIVGQQNSDHGECNNSGDILETALILGSWGICGLFPRC